MGRHVSILSYLLSLALVAGSAPANAQPLAGDWNGDGLVGAADEALLEGLYGSRVGDPEFDPAADVNGDGIIDVGDLAICGAQFGQTGPPDTEPPGLFVTLNDLPDDQNDLVVVPPDGFQITLAFDSGGHSLIDLSSLAISHSEDIGTLPAGSELAGQFAVAPARAIWEIPPGSDLARTSHYLTVSLKDLAGNETSEVYGFAVRDFTSGPPLGSPQTVYLDFDQNRSLGPDVDFLEDLREYGLSSAAAPQLESQTRDVLVGEILRRVRTYFGYGEDGSPGPDAVPIAFTDMLPAYPYQRLCVGGESAQGGNVLGFTTLDVNNLQEFSDQCWLGNSFGVFPAALDNLWGGNAEFQAVLAPFDPDLGGVPFGEHPLDAAITAPGFKLATATLDEYLRFWSFIGAADALSRAVSVAIAHETGHLLGLTAPGPLPGGLYGGVSGGNADHNVTAAGATPAENFIMNKGASFTFEEMTGRAGFPIPRFRPLSWAYLRDRVALNFQVTGLFQAPELASVAPNPVAPAPTTNVTVHGAGFLATPVVVFETESDPTPNPLLNVVFVDSNTLTGVVNRSIVPPGLYDVRVINSDGQEAVLVDGLAVQ